MPTPPSNPPTDQPPHRQVEKIKVKVKRDQRGIVTVKSSHPLPDPISIIDCLPKTLADIARPYYWHGIELTTLIHSATARKIKLTQWRAAIIQATMNTLQDVAEIETEVAVVKGYIYLTLGDGLFRAEMVDYIQSSQRALPALRQRVLDKAKEQAREIIRLAEVGSQKIRQEANVYRATINNECSRIRAEHAAMTRELDLVVPQWIKDAHYPTKTIYPYHERNALHLYFGLVVPFKIKRFSWFRSSTVEPNADLRRRQLLAVDAPSVKVLLWIPVRPDGRLQQEHIFVDSEFSRLPHTGDDRSCMTMADAPTHLANINDVDRLHQALCTVFEEVNLGSLLGAASTWYPEIYRFAPPSILEILKTNSLLHAVLERMASAGIIGDPYPQSVTFTPNSVLPAPEAVTPDTRPRDITTATLEDED